MRRLPALVLFIAGSLSASISGHAETGISVGSGDFVDSSPDFALLRQRAEGNPMLLRTLDSLVRNRAAIAESDNPLATLADMAGLRSEGFVLGEDYAFGQADLVANARIRGDLIGRVFSADLNGDMQISREELRTALASSGNSERNMAELFILGDTDEDNLLDLGEIRTVVTQEANRRQGGISGNRRGVQVAWLFDFDSNGTLTPAELARAAAALQP